MCEGHFEFEREVFPPFHFEIKCLRVTLSSNGKLFLHFILSFLGVKDV